MQTFSSLQSITAAAEVLNIRVQVSFEGGKLHPFQDTCSTTSLISRASAAL